MSILEWISDKVGNPLETEGSIPEAFSVPEVRDRITGYG
jgi:hypothetical protein